MVARVADWVDVLDGIYPQADAEPWDHVGLQVGAPDAPVTRVHVALEVTEAVLGEAQAAGADLLLTHHPLLFRPLPALTPATAPGRLALAAAGAGIAVVAAHTNFDVAAQATTTPIVDLLDLRGVTPLSPRPGGDPGQVKLVTFVPQDATSQVIAALAEAGAGVIGEYEACTFRVTGTGTFRPSAAADPAIGARQVDNEVTEDRLEVVLGRDAVPAARAALLAAHPYEEVAHDVYPLLPAPAPGDRGGEWGGDRGLGRVGDLPQPRTLGDVAAVLARGLDNPHLRLAGDPAQHVTRVAACGGAGESLCDAALAAGAEVYVTGDLRHHVTLDARTQGLALIDAGHYATEAAAMGIFADRLTAAAAARGLAAPIVRSTVRTDPWARWRPPDPVGSAEEGTPS